MAGKGLTIVADPQTRQYELTVLIPADRSATELKNLLDQMQKQLVKRGAKVISVNEWGKKPLAYTIKKGGKRYTDSLYYHYVLEMETSVVADVESDLRLNQVILRHLLLVAEPAAEPRQEAE